MTKKRKAPARRAGPIARLPLPTKAPQRHRVVRSESRAKVKERLRRFEEDGRHSD